MNDDLTFDVRDLAERWRKTGPEILGLVRDGAQFHATVIREYPPRPRFSGRGGPWSPMATPCEIPVQDPRPFEFEPRVMPVPAGWIQQLQRAIRDHSEHSVRVSVGDCWEHFNLSDVFMASKEVARLEREGIARPSGAPPAPVEAAPQADHDTSASEPAAAPVAHTPAFSATVADPAPQAASWTFIQSKRDTGYGADLNALLERRHKSGEPIPTAAEVIEIWKANRPMIFRLVGENLEYHAKSGGRWKRVQEKSLNEAIKKRTSA